MVNKIISVVIELIFPLSHIQKYIRTCSQIEFENRLTPQPQTKPFMFHPFYYKDPFVRDCILELKERNSTHIANLFGKILAGRIILKISKIISEGHNFDEDTSNKKECRNGENVFYLVPIPQHISKTKEKGFCHTTTLTKSIVKKLKKIDDSYTILFHPCIHKEKLVKKLHNTVGKKNRFNIIKNSMRAYITKEDAQHAYFFIIDDVYTTGATFKEARRSLLGCGVLLEHIFFISIAH